MSISQENYHMSPRLAVELAQKYGQPGIYLYQAKIFTDETNCHEE